MTSVPLINFDNLNGFNDVKNDAIKLLSELLKILDLHNIDYFLISGTLLGQQRHNDFIPWDDDIDLLVSNDFVIKYDLLKKDIEEYLFHTVENKYFYKFCFKDKIVSHGSYFWPFIDIFIFNLNDEKNLCFFDKKWDYDKFFPIKKVLFNDLIVSIPSEPSYFLSINYGENYTTYFESSSWNHKLEKCHDTVTILNFTV